MNKYDIDKIAGLNDAFRTSFEGGIVEMNLGLQTVDFIAEVKRRVQSFTDFNAEDNPDGISERDFGSFMLQEKRIIWRINYYDRDRTGASSNPADPDITTRVLEIIVGHKD